MRRYRLLVAVLLQCLAFLFALPAAQAQPLAEGEHIAAELIAEPSAPAGATTTLALHMRPERGWHGYWSTPGDAGFPMELKWTLPAGVTTEKPLYPVPDTYLYAGLMNHVFLGDYTVLVPLRLPADARPGTVLPIAVEANWLTCSESICVPGGAKLSTRLTVGPAKADPRFDAWRAKLPAPLGAKASFVLDGKLVRVGIPLPASVELQAPHLFLDDDHVIAWAKPQVFKRKGDLLIVEMARAEINPTTPGTLSGVLRLNNAADGVIIEAAPGAVPTGGEPLASDSAAAPALPSLPVLLLLALAGGLLLNIMPCVFPILSLKALSLARAGGSEKDARSEGLAYSAGVIVACTALGALLLALRAGGSEVGWAFQLQEPLVVAGLLLLAAAITANLLGLFEFAVPGFVGAANPRGAFATGLLAAFVATPCTGPFMAAAMGAALLLPVPQAMALFAALGLGIALPFLAIAFVPALRRRLPRPGAWMNTFRRWMALPMGLTALALLWLASRIGGIGFAAGCGMLVLVLLLLLRRTGQGQRAGFAVALPMSIGLAAIVAVGAFALPRTVSTEVAETKGIVPTTPFSEEALAQARAAKKPVFTWFTADWCLTCKVNEQVAIEREETRDAFTRGGVTVLKGDWTRRDPAITRYLTAHGAAGVPLYVWYPAGGGEPRVLPQVLTPGMLVELASGK